MLTKHKSQFAVYTECVGRPELHCLVEECKTMQEAFEKAELYHDSWTTVLVVDRYGEVVYPE